MSKALYIGYLYGIHSERQLVCDIQVNMAYRWLLQFDITDQVFDAFTLSQNRRRRPEYQKNSSNTHQKHHQ